MTGAPKEINLKGIVDDIVKRNLADVGGKIKDWGMIWEDMWEDAIDEIQDYGMLIKEDEVPEFPPFLKSNRPGSEEKVKEQLLSILKTRLSVK